MESSSAKATATKHTAKRSYAPRLPPEQRREQLLDATLTVIAEHGYGGASMEAIARSAGVTKPVVYDLFANRVELLMALLEREETRALALLDEVMSREPAKHLDKYIGDVVRGFLSSVAANRETWRLIVLPADSTPALVRAHVETGRDDVRARAEELLAGALRRPTGGEPVDVELAAQALVALGEQFARLVLTDPKRYSPERIANFVERLAAGST